MRFTMRRRIGNFKFSLVMGTVRDVKGVNSSLHNGGHIIMWEFDEPDYTKVERWLWTTQAFHGLPAIHVSQSHPGGGYHAYCLKRVEWIESIAIVAKTEGVDPGYISMCAQRGHWTLRITDKGSGIPKFVATMPSGWPETVDPYELTSWVNYEVWSNNHVLTIGEVNI